MANGIILDPNAVPDEGNFETPDDTVEELKEDHRLFMSILRGNARLEHQLMQKGRQLDPAMIWQSRMEFIMNELMGDPTQSRRRLDFEITYAEFIQSVLNRSILETK